MLDLSKDTLKNNLLFFFQSAAAAFSSRVSPRPGGPAAPVSVPALPPALPPPIHPAT